MQTCKTACSWHLLQSHLKGALQPTTILTCFATLFFFFLVMAQKTTTQKSAHIRVIADTLASAMNESPSFNSA